MYGMLVGVISAIRPSALAQRRSRPGVIQARVTDQSGALVPGGTVEVRR
jgi:hypothetical protein